MSKALVLLPVDRIIEGFEEFVSETRLSLLDIGT